jgi:hypothetical protein
MFDGLLKTDDDTDPKGDQSKTYEDGREGRLDILGTDTEDEANARERGNEDRIDAEKTREENDKAEEDKKDDE